MRDAVTNALPFGSETTAHYLPELPVVLRMAVPGWPQIYLGRKAVGRMMLFSYGAFLFSGLVFIGTFVGSLLLGLAFTCHASSIVDVVTASTDEVRRRLAICAGLIAAVGLLVYLPAGRMVSYFVVPRVIVRDVSPFAAGDVVLLTPTGNAFRASRPGDVVMYEPPVVSTDRQQHRIVRIEGARIDRILAVAGQRVVWSDGKLEVDGNPSNLLPLNPQRCGFRFETVVPAGHFLILPSSLDVGLMAEVGAAQVRALSEVRASDVLGRVFLRQQPLSRFLWVR
jgi:type IV secretory pathway protease TraF